MYYVAVDIGCIECGEESNILGIFSKKKDALKILNDHEKRQLKYWHGEHSFELFEVEEIDQKIIIDYSK